MSQNPETPITPETIAQMSEEEHAALKRDLSKKLMRRLAINTVVTVTIAVGVHILCKKLDSEIEELEAEENKTETDTNE